MSVFYFVRTAEGQSAAYDATSAMPRKLRSLLKVVDGKTSEAVFASSLKAFGDIKGLLQSLQSAGLIELRQAEVESAPTSMPIAENVASRAAADSRETGFAATQTAQASQSFARESQLAAHQHNHEQMQQRQQDVQLLVQDMSSFVLAYVPAQAFTVLSELEQITTIEQVAVLLGGYELMVNEVGEPAKIHLRHVRKCLSKWL